MEKNSTNANLVNKLNIDMLIQLKFLKYPYIRGRIMIHCNRDMETVDRAFVKPKYDPELILPNISIAPLSTEN